MIRSLVLGSVLVLSSCGQGAKPADSATTATSSATPATTPAAFDLSCAAFANATGANLEQRYGVANVVQQSIAGAEGEESQGTVLFPNDPARRVEIFWNDTAGRTSPSSITISGTQGQRSQWTGPHNLTLGESMADVEHANGGAFTLYGFEWDYGGTVTDWRGGALAPDDNCHVRVGFQATGDSGRAAGDTAFRSDSAEMRAAHPYVAVIGVSFIGTPTGQSDQTNGK